MKYVLNTEKINLLNKYGFFEIKNKFSIPIWIKNFNDEVYLEIAYPDYELLLTYKYDNCIVNELVNVVQTINELFEQNIIIQTNY